MDINERLKIDRTLATDLKAHLDKPEMTLLIGPRQAGKTTLLRAMAAELKENGVGTLFYNIDIDRDRALFETQEKFVRTIDLETGGEKHYIFIDEIQRLPDAGLFFKGIYDRNLPHKYILTGSGSLELKERIAESLVGRKRNFYLYTVSPGEFAHFKTKYRYGDRLAEKLHQDAEFAESILSEYLTYGGYPAVVTEATRREKLRTLGEIYGGYIERDIKNLLRLEKSSAFVTLLRLLAGRSGQTVNYSDLSLHTGLNQATVKNYLWYTEKTFITARVNPYFTNREKEIVKAPTYYFLDTGLRNYLRGIFDDPNDRGFRFQAMVYRLLEAHFRHTSASVHFWRTKSKAEVDFVVDRGFTTLPVEVKATALSRPKVTRSYRSFLKQYTPPEGWIVNRTLRETITIGTTRVKFIPWYDLIDRASL